MTATDTHHQVSLPLHAARVHASTSTRHSTAGMPVLMQQADRPSLHMCMYIMALAFGYTTCLLSGHVHTIISVSVRPGVTCVCEACVISVRHV